MLINALVRASQAGADIDLIVRGACVLRPGVPGATDRIRVRSVVGRFLEHTRVMYFRWGPGEEDEVLYLSSADWMSRNMLCVMQNCGSVSSTNASCPICTTAVMPGC